MVNDLLCPGKRSPVPPGRLCTGTPVTRPDVSLSGRKGQQVRARAPASQDAVRAVRAAKFQRGGGSCRRAGRNLGDHLLPGRNAPSSRPAAGTVPAAAVIRVRDGAGRPSGDGGGARVMAARLRQAGPAVHDVNKPGMSGSETGTLGIARRPRMGKISAQLGRCWSWPEPRAEPGDLRSLRCWRTTSNE